MQKRLFLAISQNVAKKGSSLCFSLRYQDALSGAIVTVVL
jgi:hypothetical protein